MCGCVHAYILHVIHVHVKFSQLLNAKFVCNFPYFLTVANQCLSAEVKPMYSSHVERSTAVTVLDIGVSSSLHEQLHAESTVVREGGVVEGGLALVVESVDAHFVLEEDVNYYVLAVVAGHVERGAAV